MEFVAALDGSRGSPRRFRAPPAGAPIHAERPQAFDLVDSPPRRMRDLDGMGEFQGSMQFGQ